MGRKPSNVYDFFERIEPTEDTKGLVRYECKKCLKQYASNATRLADHLKTSGCYPSFQSNQKERPSLGGSSSTNGSAARSTSTPDAKPVLVDAPAAAVSLPTTTAPPYETSAMEVEETALDTDLLLRLAKTSTCAIADAMQQLHIHGHLVNVDLVRGFANPLSVNICGPALTVQVVPATGASIKKLPFNYVDTTDVGHVIVISAPANCTSAVFGGLYATAAKVRSVAAVVTDGRVRDVQEMSSMGFPAFATGTSVHGQRGATSVVDVGAPIVVAGVVVRNADIVRADVNGVVVIPIERAVEIAARAEVIDDQDNRIAEAVEQGESLQRSMESVRAKMV